MARLRVMTRNLYVGSEFEPVLEAGSLQAALEAVPRVLEEVLGSEFPERARLIAGEIAQAAPDVVGLQEAVVIRSGPAGDGEASEVIVDYLRLLLDEVDARGADLALAAEIANIDATLPSGFPPATNLRLTDRDALLVRTGLPAGPIESGTFTARGSIDVGGAPIEFARGWISADIELDGRDVRLVTTHLETSQFPDVQIDQARELLAGVIDTDLPVVLIGDLNAQAPDAPAFRMLLDAGFVDAWPRIHAEDPGLTCCQDPDLRNAESHLYERIDLVLVRGDLEVVDVALTGLDERIRTPAGLWPSDHAGVVATLELS